MQSRMQFGHKQGITLQLSSTATPQHHCSAATNVHATRCRPHCRHNTNHHGSKRSTTRSRATTSSDESGAPTYFPVEDYFLLGDGDVILRPQKRTDWSPKYDYTMDDAISIQLKALQTNDQPRYDHGIEVLYRFANFDPFQRSKYFGKSFDLGQFERFRRIMHIPAYKPLLNHERWQTLSTLKLSERVWKTRIHVTGEYGRDEGVFEITMIQRLGGRFDGFWFTESFIADGNDWKTAFITY